uniref:Apterous n=1 Tax=Neanthes arenaceodentata TaxID=604281 RepID=G4W9E1_9ANNE|nr:apterous [Neanthes arenaceodentata]
MRGDLLEATTMVEHRMLALHQDNSMEERASEGIPFSGDAFPSSNAEQTMPVVAGEVEPAPCAGCGGKIIDRYYLLAVDKQWHINCLKCADCHLPLDSELTCFAKDGEIFCKEDYYRRFAVKRCSRCHQAISANELVMRAREHVFHIGCFTCASCSKALTTGDYFGMKDHLIYCRSHYEHIMQGAFIGSPPPPSLSHGGPMSPCLSPGPPGPPPGGPMSFYNGVGTTQKGRPRKRKSPMPESDPCLALDDCSIYFCMAPNENEMSMGQDGVYPGPPTGQPPRQKRVRTSFKHHQLRTMKSYFALNHNPDAKDLKQLAQKTGLSKRVLQVWFQNARAKYRRNVLKQQGDPSRDGKPGGDVTKSDSQSATTLSEISNSRSPALSDISSTPSLSDLHNAMSESEQNSSGSSLTELFTNSINAMA